MSGNGDDPGPDTICDRIREAFKKEGEFVDWWTLVHTGFGFISGLLLNALGFSIFEGFLIVLILATLWEFIEPTIYRILRVLFPSWDIPEEFPERKTNSVVDILVALIGFMFAKFLDSLIDTFATGVWAPDFSLGVPDAWALVRAGLALVALYALVLIPVRMAIQVRTANLRERATREAEH